MGSLPIKSDLRVANGSQVNAIIADPRNPKNVYAAGPAGVFYSTDAGLTWTARSNGLNGAVIVALTLNLMRPDTLLAMTTDNVLFRSDDGGKTWQGVSPS